MPTVKRVAVIGAGPAGAIAIDALAQEQAFDVIRVFERREKAGGCWIADSADHTQQLPDLDKIARRACDEPLANTPTSFPCTTPRSRQYRFDDTSIYPFLETNIDAGAMAFSQEPFPSEITELSVARHGPDSPFRHWSSVQRYIEALVQRRGYEALVSYNTTVERVQVREERAEGETGEDGGGGGKWLLTLRESGDPSAAGGDVDHWRQERFDAVVVASGHYSVPYVPFHHGLAAFARAHPGVVEHSKSFRDPRAYAGRKVVVLGASISGADIASFVAPHARPPLVAVVRGRYHPYFFDYAFQHPNIMRRGPIARFDSEAGRRRIVFEDGSVEDDVDHVIFGTGYSWTVPFLRDVEGLETRNNRLPGLYEHVFWMKDPTLCFVGAVAAGFTFKVYEWQSVLAARFLASRAALPPLAEQEAWERARVSHKGDGVAFTALYPDFGQYFEEVRALAGEAGPGRKLPAFDPAWRRDFDAGHVRRINMWKRANEAARRDRAAGGGGGGGQVWGEEVGVPSAVEKTERKQAKEEAEGVDEAKEKEEAGDEAKKAPAADVNKSLQNLDLGSGEEAPMHGMNGTKSNGAVAVES